MSIIAIVVLVGFAPPAFGHDGPSRGSFVSLTGAEGHVIERFSLAGGRHLGVVARVPRLRSTSEQSYVSHPRLMPDGRYLVADAHDINCEPVASSECIPIFNTCASRIESLDPASKRFHLLFTVPGNRVVLDAVPSPDGRRVALLERGCDPHGGANRIVIRDLGSGTARVAANNLGPCSELMDLSWTMDGSHIAFAYAPNSSEATQVGCSVAIASARHHSAKSAWRLIAPDSGCTFSSAAVDPAGLIALEACGLAGTAGSTGLLQFDQHLRLTHRLTLQSDTAPLLEPEESEVANDPEAHTVLVSEFEADAYVVRTFGGRRLRLIGRYKKRVLAEP